MGLFSDEMGLLKKAGEPLYKTPNPSNRPLN